jgi:hypothetical protein
MLLVFYYYSLFVQFKNHVNDIMELLGLR